MKLDLIQKIKRFFYFPVASYFRFFAKIRLGRWNPKVVVVTGSSGKTTLLHLIESQLGKKVKYSHEANSSFGIPFDILGIRRKNLTLFEWPWIFLAAPFGIFKKLPKEKIYVVEADCDRPYEGKFLGEFLKPDVTLWLNVSRTHCMNFDFLVKRRRFSSIEEAIAFEFGYFAQNTKDLVIANGDSKLILDQLQRAKCSLKKLSLTKSLKKYEVDFGRTVFIFDSERYSLKFPMPRKTALSILMTMELLNYFKTKPDKNFSLFVLAPGRSSVFQGIRNATIVDSTYNANFDSAREIIEMFSKLKAKEKWVVLGDMLEQGKEEQEEHEKLAQLIARYNFKRIILMGPRITKYTYPVLKKFGRRDVILKHFLEPKEVLEYLLCKIKGGETILFKGARFLEGVIENLLHDKNESKNLVRREKAWEIRRKKWGL